MFNFISAFIRIYRSCLAHHHHVGVRRHFIALKSAVKNSRTVASMPYPVAWVSHDHGWSPVGLVEIDGEWVPEGDPYYYLAATTSGFLPIPWWGTYSFMGDGQAADPLRRSVENSEEAIQAEKEYIYGW